MVLNEDTNMILSDLELNICVRLLGRKKWKAYPVARDRGQSLSERVSGAIVKLISDGMIERTGDGVRCAQTLTQLLTPVAHPERIVVVATTERYPVSFFCRDSACTTVEQLSTQPQSCRIGWAGQERVKELYQELLGEGEVWGMYIQTLNGEGKVRGTVQVVCREGQYWQIQPQSGEKVLFDERNFLALMEQK